MKPALLAAPWLLPLLAPAPLAPSHVERELRGFRVLVEAVLLEGPADLGERALDLLSCELLEVERALPAAALAALREVPIWLSAADPVAPCAVYHPSADWLRANGHDPRKARAVEITSAERFLEWSLDQPSMVLHELAHAFHHRVLGYDEPRLVEAFERASRSGLYERVLRNGGSRARAYALRDPKEFFAEASEAFFGTNDFYPFVRAELVDHDPATAALLAELWGL